MGGSQSYQSSQSRQSHSYNSIQRPNIDKCEYKNPQYDYKFPGNQNHNQCKNGDDNSIGYYKKREYYEFKKTPCILDPDNKKTPKIISYTQNCPCKYGGYETVTDIQTRQYEPIDLTGVVGVTDSKMPTTIYGKKRINGGNVVNCPLFIGPYSASFVENSLPDSEIQVPNGESLLETILSIEEDPSPPITVDGFTGDMNDTLKNNAKLLNVFNDTYYSYVYKCRGDEKDQESMLQILKDINNNPSLTYEQVMEKAAQIQPSKTVINDGVNKMDCATLKETLLKFNDYNNKTYTSPITNLTKYDVYDSKHKKIIDDYKTLNVERNSLDQKLRDLYNIPGYNSSNSKLEFDSTIYTGIIITIVASSLVYYAFTKL